MVMPLTAPGHVAGSACRASCDRMAHASTSCTLFSKPAPSQSISLSSSQTTHRIMLREQSRRGQVLVRSFNVDAEEEEENPRQRRGRRERPQEKKIGDDEVERDADGFEERVLQVSRVTKVVKGGKQMSFRAVVCVGDDKGQVGVGCSAAKEVVTAVEKAVIDAKRHLVRVPITRGKSFPHRVNGNAGGAKVMLRPASEGTGVIAGGAVRTVLELSGIKNGFGKQLGSDNPLNNARATVDGLSQLRTLQQVADERHLTVGEMLAFKPEPKQDKTLVAA